jgi:hypothetical protein
MRIYGKKYTSTAGPKYCLAFLQILKKWYVGWEDISF